MTMIKPDTDTSKTMNKRYIPACSPDHECTYEEIQGIIDEYIAISKDENIKHYDDPSLEELIEVISIAESYSGPWYHSVVTLHDETKDINSDLKQRIYDLGAEAGITVLTSYNMPELDEMFSRMKTSSSDIVVDNQL